MAANGDAKKVFIGDGSHPSTLPVPPSEAVRQFLQLDHRGDEPVQVDPPAPGISLRRQPWDEGWAEQLLAEMF